MSKEERIAESFSPSAKRGWLVGVHLRRETRTLVNKGAFDKYCFPWTPAKRDIPLPSLPDI